MPLTHFAVVHEHVEPLNRVLIHCFDDRQVVLVSGIALLRKRLSGHRQ